jgi:hypothetical protein
MDVIGHQAVGMDMGPVSRRELAQMKEIKNVVVASAKARAPVDCSLNYVSGYTGEEEAQLTWHLNCQRPATARG